MSSILLIKFKHLERTINTYCSNWDIWLMYILRKIHIALNECQTSKYIDLLITDDLLGRFKLNKHHDNERNKHMTNVINKYFKFEQCSIIFYFGNNNICVYTMKLICRKLFPRIRPSIVEWTHTLFLTNEKSTVDRRP